MIGAYILASRKPGFNSQIFFCSSKEYLMCGKNVPLLRFPNIPGQRQSFAKTMETITTRHERGEVRIEATIWAHAEVY